MLFVNLMNKFFLPFLFAFLAVGCLPKEPIVFKTVKNIELITTEDGKLQVKGDAVFYNPNKTQTKLKEIDVDILVDGKKAAEVDQQMDLVVKGQADFTVPIVAQLKLEEINLLDAVVSFFGGKKYQIMFTGNLRVAVHGVTVKVPVAFKDEIKLK